MLPNPGKPKDFLETGKPGVGEAGEGDPGGRKLTSGEERHDHRELGQSR